MVLLQCAKSLRHQFITTEGSKNEHRGISDWLKTVNTFCNSVNGSGIPENTSKTKFPV
jgi:hypothetical protein